LEVRLRPGEKPVSVRLRQLLPNAGASSFLNDCNSEVFSRDGRWVAACRGKKEMLVWSVSGNASPRCLQHPGDQEVVAFRFSPNGERLLTIGKDGTVAVWSTAEGRLIGPPLDPRVQVWAFDDLLYSRPPVEEEQGGKLEVRGAIFSADGARVATLATDRAARLWDLTKNIPPRELRLHLGGRTATFSKDGRLLAVADANEVRVWSTRPPAEPLLFAHPTKVYAGALAPDRKSLLTGCEDGTARLWSLTDPGLLREFDARAGRPIQAVAFNGDGRMTAAAYHDGAVRLWNSDGGPPLVEFTEHREEKPQHTGVRFSPDRQHVLSWTERTARVWRIDGQGKSVVLKGPSAIEDATFDPGGVTVATAHEDGTAKVWERATGKVLFELGGPRGHHAALLSVTFSPNGRHILTASEDGTARLWRPDGRGRAGRSSG
jgi:WD40 repeat protein